MTNMLYTHYESLGKEDQDVFFVCLKVCGVCEVCVRVWFASSSFL